MIIKVKDYNHRLIPLTQIGYRLSDSSRHIFDAAAQLTPVND